MPEPRSNIEQTKSLLEQILETDREKVAVLRGIEALLDVACQKLDEINDATAESAFMSHNFVYRTWIAWKHHRWMHRMMNDPQAGLDELSRVLGRPHTIEGDEDPGWPGPPDDGQGSRFPFPFKK